MADQFLGMNDPFNVIPQMNSQMMIAQNTERIAVGLDMLVGLLSEVYEYDLKEVKDENGKSLLRWRPRGTEATESESEESSDSQA
jgi:hypothetical protein